MVVLHDEAVLSHFIKTMFFHSLAISHEWSWLAGFHTKLQIVPHLWEGGGKDGGRYPEHEYLFEVWGKKV